MEPMPIGKRTRLQTAIQDKEFREKRRQSRIKAILKYRKDYKLVSIDDDDNNEDNEDAGQFVDLEEYDKCEVKGSNVSYNDDVNFQFNQFRINQDHTDTGLRGNLNGDGNDSDDSLVVLGEQWNPSVMAEYDDIDDSDDDDDIEDIVFVGDGDDVSASSEGEDDDNDNDKDYNINNYSSSDYASSSSLSSSSDETSSDCKENGVSRVREHKQKRRESRKERRKRKKNERVYERKCMDNKDNVGGTSEGKSRKRVYKKKERKSREEVFEDLLLSVDHGNEVRDVDDVDLDLDLDVVSSSRVARNVDGRTGSSRSGNGSGSGKSRVNQSVRMKKGSDGVFRKVASSTHDEDDKISRQIWRKSNPSHSTKKVGSTSEEADDVDVDVNVDVEPRKKGRRVLGEEERSERKKNSVQKSKRKKKQKAIEVQNTLLDTINKEVEEPTPMPMPMPTRTLINLVPVPLKFRFPAEEDGDEVEKPEEEEDMENLFKDLEFALQACHMGSDSSTLTDATDAMDVDQPANVDSEKTLCAGGNHCLVHDEEIGIYCRFCSYVHLESRFVTADLASNADLFGRARKESNKVENEDKTSENLRTEELFGDKNNEEENPALSKITKGTVWSLIPGTWETLYPHQREGFEFIWRNVDGGIRIEELNQRSKYGLGGCIICHAPGTGKTRLAIVFIQSFLRQYPNSRPMIIAPRTMLRTWQEEFMRWKVDVTFFNVNEDELTGKEDANVMDKLDGCRDKKSIRLAKVITWNNGVGILGISYGLYKKMVNERNKGNEIDRKVRTLLLENPCLMILDEGHTPRNDKSSIWKALSDAKTKRKVILSGTPFQNNFEELSNTLSLVREEFRGAVKPGSYDNDVKKIEALRNKIRPFVNVHKGEILKETLKGLFSTLVVLKPSMLQVDCFTAIEAAGLPNFTLETNVSLASVHPSIFNDSNTSFIDKALLESHKEDLDAGVKTRFLVELIKLSQDERVLVFGQYLLPLSFLAGLLKSIFQWTMGKELLYMDGQQDAKERQNTIRFFNDPKSEARVLLASTKACCEGIHLVGASRVVLLDVVWNPSVERQAISRAYRLGQKKDVFVYHLITSGTLEERKYKRQATKERLSELVFSSSDGKSVKKASSLSHFFADRILEAMLDHEKLKEMFENIVYQPKADNLIDSFSPLNM